MTDGGSYKQGYRCLLYERGGHYMKSCIAYEFSERVRLLKNYIQDVEYPFTSGSVWEVFKYIGTCDDLLIYEKDHEYAEFKDKEGNSVIQ